jgi:hypothetical protein
VIYCSLFSSIKYANFGSGPHYFPRAHFQYDETNSGGFLQTLSFSTACFQHLPLQFFQQPQEYHLLIQVMLPSIQDNISLLSLNNIPLN